MNFKSHLFVLGFVCLFSVAYAQNSLPQMPDTIQIIDDIYSDTLNIKSSDLVDIESIKQYVDEDMSRLIDIQREESLRQRGIDGYRVQIFQGNKDDAFKTKAAFMQKYPGYKVYVLFKTPDFRVRVGDFRTRSEAIKTKYLIEKDFANPYIVDDIINYPKLKSNNLK